MEEPRANGGRTCPECGAANPKASRFCEACGVSLASAARARDAGDGAGDAGDADLTEAERPRAGRRRRSRAPADRVQKVEIQRTLSRARRHIASIRWFCWFAAAGYAVYGMVLYLVAGRAEAELLGDVEGAGVVRVLAYALWGTAAVLALGALSVHRQPFAWTVGLASFLTLFVVVEFVVGAFPILEVIVTLGFWGTVPLMARAARILREHGDEYGSEHLLRRVGRDVGESEVRRHAAERRQRARRQGLKTWALVVGVAVVVVVVGVLVYGAATASSTLDSRLVTFRTAWEANDMTQVEAMLSRDYRSGSWSRTERILEREGWDTDTPPLGPTSIVSRSDTWAEVHFELPVGKIRTRWAYRNSMWQLDGVIFDRIRSGR